MTLSVEYGWTRLLAPIVERVPAAPPRTASGGELVRKRAERRRRMKIYHLPPPAQSECDYRRWTAFPSNSTTTTVAIGSGIGRGIVNVVIPLSFFSATGV